MKKKINKKKLDISTYRIGHLNPHKLSSLIAAQLLLPNFFGEHIWKA
jgi:hypothetical protein